MGSCRLTSTPLSQNIDTYDSRGGKNRATLDAWEEATDVDMVATTESYILECYDTGDHDDGTILDGAGGDTDADYHRIIRPASGEGHSGTHASGVSFAYTTDLPMLRINESYSQLQDIIGTLIINSSNIRLTFGASGDQSKVIGCLSVNSGNAGSGTAIGIMGGPGGGTGTKYIINCLALDNGASGYDHDQDTAYYYNCTSHGNYNGFDRDGGIANTVNCLSDGNDNNDFSGTWSDNTNSSSDATSPTVALRNQTNAFVGVADFHLAIGDDAIDAGTDLSADGTFAFNDDINDGAMGAAKAGETRSGTWDIGFDEYVAVGGVAPTGALYGPLVGPMGGPI